MLTVSSAAPKNNVTAVRVLAPSQILTLGVQLAQISFPKVAVHFSFTSMSSTGRFPLGLNRFLNAVVPPAFCTAYNVPLKNSGRKKIISSFPFYPALCHFIHLGKCSTCMIRGILKEKWAAFTISIFFFLPLFSGGGAL